MARAWSGRPGRGCIPGDGTRRQSWGRRTDSLVGRSSRHKACMTEHADSWVRARAMGLYRLRWQIELFKRLRSLLNLEHSFPARGRRCVVGATNAYAHWGLPHRLLPAGRGPAPPSAPPAAAGRARACPIGAPPAAAGKARACLTGAPPAAAGRARACPWTLAFH